MTMKQCDVKWCTATAEEHAGVCAVHRAQPVLHGKERVKIGGTWYDREGGSETCAQWTTRLRAARAVEERHRALKRGERARA